jgi:drug/metabolite transporter (DMT)-like permease
MASTPAAASRAASDPDSDPDSAGARPASAAAIALALGSLYLIWGSTYLGIRFALEGGWPALIGVSGGRMLFAGIVLFAILRLRGVAAPTRAQWPRLALMGLLMLFVGNGAVVVAEQEVSSGLAAIAIASTPLWMGVFGIVFRQVPRRGEWIGIGIGFLGVLWLNAGSGLSSTPRGLALLLSASIAWSFGSLWSRGRDLPASPFMTAAGQMLCGGVMLVVLGLCLGERLPAAPTALGTAALAYLAVFGSIVGFCAYLWLLDHVRPALAGSYAYVNPPIAVLLGVWLGGEHVGGHEIGAMVLILAGVVAIARARTRKADA